MAQHLSAYRVSALCEALQVSRSGFFITGKALSMRSVPSIRPSAPRSLTTRPERVRHA